MKKKVLIVDDKQTIAKIIQVYISDMFECIYFDDPIKSIAWLQEGNLPDLIISDIHLKNECGLDFIKKFRETNNETPILILSGYKDEELLFKAMTLNLSGYLIKPINFKVLMEALVKCKNKIKFNNQKITMLKDGFNYDKELKIVTKEQDIFELNKKEILFFEMLCENKQRIITKDMFIKFVYEYEPMSDSALNNFVLRIRKRFGKNFLHTIPDVGYKMII